jgi:hypothetical protein
MKLSQADLIRMYRIFLSSGDDARDLRDRVQRLVYDAINPSLLQSGANVRLEIDRWEVTAAARTRGTHTNEQFVQRAREAQVTMALLLQTLGDGTREELQAVLDETEEELSALWFIHKHEKPDSEVAQFLDSNRQRLYFDKTGPPDDEESWIGVTRVLMQTVLEALKPPEAVFSEQR